MSEYVLARIQAIQQELEALRKTVAHQLQGSRKKTQLKGLWKGIEVTEEDLKAAQQAVFRDAYEWEE
jgi:hypothetical protein